MNTKTRGAPNAKRAKRVSGKQNVRTSNIGVPTDQGAAEWFQASCASFAKGADAFNLMAFEIARINTRTAFDYAGQISDVESPSDFIKLSTVHVGNQFAIASAQNQQLWGVIQGIANDAVERMSRRWSTRSGIRRVRV
jgi:hypothetical protein